MLLWFGLTLVSVLFLALDIHSTPESPVLKWGFVLLTLYSGPFGAFLYVLGCREPLPGLHERFVAVRWRQVLGSTMHCVAGDGVGILAGAVIGALIALPRLVDLGLEYVLGFGFGWAIFQALFMREMFGSYGRSLGGTFMAELLSMNCLMGGMIPVASLAWAGVAAAHDPTSPLFWFRMSVALMAGFVVAYPMNWWLVANHLKHGMMTVRHRDESARKPVGGAMAMGATPQARGAVHNSKPSMLVMTAVSFGVLAIGLAITWVFGGLSSGG